MGSAKVAPDGEGKGAPTGLMANKPLLMGLAAVLALGAVGGIVAGIVVGTSAPASPPPSMPPPPPPPPPNVPVGTAAAQQVTTSFKASGDVADYTPAKVNGIKGVVAKEAGVDTKAVDVTVAAGSVIITVAITVANKTAAAATAAVLTGDASAPGIFADATTLAAALTAGGVTGVTVTEISAAPTAVVAFISSPPPSTPPPPPSPPPAPISPAAAPETTTFPLIGHWLDNWGAAITITATQWISVSSYGASTYTIDSYGAQYVMMQNSPNASWNPSLWTKMQYHTVGAGFGYCSTVYNGKTKTDALLTDTRAIYNASESGAGGCSSFAHSVASPYTYPISGTYLDDWGGYHTINNDKWYSGTSAPQSISVFSKGMSVLQNHATASWGASKWKKIEHHAVGTGFGFCTSVYDKATMMEALMFDTSTIYNASESGKGGCGSFAHSVASPYAMPRAGTYLDNWGGYHTFTNKHYYSGSTVYRIEMYTNNLVLMENPSNAYYANKWSKMMHHTVGTGFGFCSVKSDAATALEALTTDTTVKATNSFYNASESGAGGCGVSFSHSVASPYDLRIKGAFTDNWNTALTITNTQFTSGSTVYAIEMYTDKFIIMQNPATDKWNPSKWTRVDFHTVGTGFGYCMSVYNAPTAQAAFGTDVSAIYNASESGAGGCSSFSHSIASPNA